MILVLAKVPLAITSSLPLLAPYVLKSFGSIPFPYKYLPAGEFFEILPAGEIWSVVIESPKFNKQYPFAISGIDLGAISVYLKNGGSWIYVEVPFHLYSLVSAATSLFHLSVPLAILL